MKAFLAAFRIYFPSWKFFDTTTAEHFEFEFSFGTGEEAPAWSRLPSEKRRLKHLFYNPFENMRAYVFSRLDTLMREKDKLEAQELLQLDGLAKALVSSYSELRDATEKFVPGGSSQFRYRLLLLDLSEGSVKHKGLVSTVIYTSPAISWEF